jgi:hypothetical protein
MRMSRALSCLAWLVLATAAPACRPPAIEAPYASPELLLGAVAPRISALQVSSAKVRIGRSPAGNLMFLAQKPGRFSGQVQIAGRELVSLAFHEQGYMLRNVAADGLPTGFYAGPPADCAIRNLIGVPFSAQELIALVLGGAPRIPGPYEIVDQHWDRQRGHEVLRLRSARSEQELRFAWVAGAWWVAGSTLWNRGSGDALTRVWSLMHEDLRQVEGTVLPGSTRISRPAGRRDERVTISYRTRLVDPDLGDAEPGAEGEDEGWEDEDTAAAPEAADGGDEAAAPAPEAPTPAPVQPAAPPAAPKIPPQFTLDGAGLSPRGDLCRGR